MTLNHCTETGYYYHTNHCHHRHHYLLVTKLNYLNHQFVKSNRYNHHQYVRLLYHLDLHYNTCIKITKCKFNVPPSEPTVKLPLILTLLTNTPLAPYNVCEKFMLFAVIQRSSNIRIR